MIYNCMSFLNENDALEIKLNTCWDSIDKFIVLESNQTHTGDPKPYNLDLDRFSKYSEKLQYVQIGSIDNIINNHPELVCKYLAADHNNKREVTIDWMRDSVQFAMLPLIAIQNGASDDDLMLVQCCDEIASPEAISEAKAIFASKKKFPPLISGHIPDPTPSMPVRINELGEYIDPVIMFTLLNYYYKANMQDPQRKTSRQSIITTIRNLKLMMPSTLRHLTIHTHKPIPNGGWHFGFLDATDGQMVLEKYKSWAHSRDVNSNYYSIATKEEAVVRLQMELRLQKTVLSRETHPSYLIDNLSKYQHIIIN